MAAARASVLSEELATTVSRLSDQLTQVMGELQTLSDPDAAAAQVETVTVETAQRVADAELSRSRAETAAREARDDAKSADAAARVLEEQGIAADQARSAAEERERQALAEAEIVREQLDTARSELTAVASERDQVVTDLAQVRRDLDAATDQLTAAVDAASRAEAETAALRERLDAAVRELSALGVTHAGTVAELAGAKGRAADYREQVERGEAARAAAEVARATAQAEVARTEAYLEQAHARIDELSSNRTKTVPDEASPPQRTTTRQKRAVKSPGGTHSD